MSENAVYDEIKKIVLRYKKPKHPLIIGVNGVDGSGKTSFVKILSSILDNCVCIHIDDFHNSKNYRYKRGEESPEGYYYDSIDYDSFINKALKPIKYNESECVQIQSKLFDITNDTPDHEFKHVSKRDIVLVEGVFLFRPEIIKFFDISIFVECTFEITLKRMIERDIKNKKSVQNIENYKTRTQKKYIAGQKLYFDKISPKSKANIIINNNDFSNPAISYIDL